MTESPRTMSIISQSQEVLEFCDGMAEQDIDREFLFRFEYGWNLRVERLRRCINRLAGRRDSSSIMPESLGAKMWAYLEITNHFMDCPQPRRDPTDREQAPPFRPFNDQKREDYDVAISSAIWGDNIQLSKIQYEVDKDMELVKKIQEDLLRFGMQYQIVPLSLDQWERIPLEKIDDHLVNLRNHILFDYPLPRFIWSSIRYLESPTEKAVTRWLRPIEATNLKSHKESTRRLRSRTRTRTWTVYFLSRRGGGQFTEPQAVEIWNLHNNDSLTARNFRSDRESLLNTCSYA
jgi:hypothetical protein